MAKPTKKQSFKEDPPPIFQSWNQLYAFVLVLHTIIISFFYMLTHAYS